MATLGDSCIDRVGEGIGNGYTVIFTKYQFPNPANISSWCCYVSLSSSNARLKVFRDDGTNWIFVGESSLQAVTVGLNSGLTANINVQYGDYIAFYIETGSGVERGGTLYSVPVKVGDISTDSLKSSWDANSGEFLSLQVTYTLTGLDNVYVALTGNDSNSGGTLASSKLTLYGGISVLNYDANLHIGFGDFSAQTSFQINKTMTWMFDTSGGIGTVTFPATI